MLKSLAKAISILMIAGLNWIGISKVSGTYAMFSDPEISESGTFAAGTLDLSVSSSALSLTLGAVAATASSTIDVFDNGSIPFAYRLKTSAASSVGGLCDQLVLTAALDDAITAFTGSLSVFETDEILITAGQDQWTVAAALLPGADLNALKGANCEFAIDADAKQPGLTGWTRGFTDVEHIFGAIIATDADPPLVEGNGLSDFGSGKGDAPELETIEIVSSEYSGTETGVKTEKEIKSDGIGLDSIAETDNASDAGNRLTGNASGKTADDPPDTGNATGETPVNDLLASTVVGTEIGDNAANIDAPAEKENDAGAGVPAVAEVQTGAISKVESAPVPIGENDVQDGGEDFDSESPPVIKAISELNCQPTGLASDTREATAEIIQATSGFSSDTAI